MASASTTSPESVHTPTNVGTRKKSVRERFRWLLSLLVLLSPFWALSLKNGLLKGLVLLAYGYLGILILLLFMENWLLYHPGRDTQSWMKPPAGLQVDDVQLHDALGNVLHGWWSKPTGWVPARGAILLFHGNAGNLSHRGEQMKQWRDRLGMAVLLVDYPGFGRSSGSPTEAGVYATADAALDWVVTVAGVTPDHVVLIGGSLGAAVAVDLGVRRPCAAVVLISGFTSFPDMAAKSFPWLPGRWLVRNQLNTLGKISHLHCPIFVAHSPEDRLIPLTQGERNFAAANEPKRFYSIPNWPHQDGVTPGAVQAIKDFLDTELSWRRELDG